MMLTGETCSCVHHQRLHGCCTVNLCLMHYHARSFVDRLGRGTTWLDQPEVKQRSNDVHDKLMHGACVHCMPIGHSNQLLLPKHV